MRIVKYQAWHFERKVMYECAWVGQFECQALTPSNKLFSNREIFDWKDTPRGKAEVAIHRYTGREDSEGNEIYAGLILSSGVEVNPRICEVYWDDECAGFFVRHKPTKFNDPLYMFLSCTSVANKIVGNIYENEELLMKGGSDGKTQ